MRPGGFASMEEERMQGLTGQSYVERYGHEWNVPERSEERRVGKECRL